MRKRVWQKVLSMILCGSMVVGSASAISGCGISGKQSGPITLDVYSMVANYSGKQTGWIADIIKEKFNVVLNIIPDGDGVYETRMEEGNLGDIVIFGNSSDNYVNAVKSGVLLDWNADDLLSEYGPYIKENMPDAIKKNQEITQNITDGKSDTLYGIANDIALTSEDHQAFMYTWDIRWDVYKQLGYPQINTLDEFQKLLEDMQKACPKDDAGNRTYAVSLWPDWDVDYVMYVKATATSWYGYDELGLGLYDPQTGKLHGALEENGPYLTFLKFYNNLYQKGLVDPDSMTQTYDKMAEKVQNGGVLFSIFNYCGSMAYNKKEHTQAGKMMCSMKPEDATPIVYGMNTRGGDYVTCIGANSEYPEVCMELLNYFTTPEGCMTYRYGPKGVTWDYDEEGYTYFTELGKECSMNQNTKIGNGYKGTYHDGMLQAAFSTWSVDAENPDSNGETYNKDNWRSNNLEAESEIEQDWRDHTGCNSTAEYFDKKGQFVVAPGTSFALEAKDDELKTTWSQVTSEIKNGTWKAIYAESDKEFNKIVDKMIKNADHYGYQECLKWTEGQAQRRYEMEQALEK